MKNVWLYFLASGFTAAAFTFPLFMFFRERKILKNKLAGGSLERFEFDNHKVDIWVPPTLNAKTPVVVMHDGRNVFDEADSYTGKTWEVLTALREEVRGELPLVIAVWGLSDDTRIRELSPQKISDAHPEFWDIFPDEYKTTGTDSFENGRHGRINGWAYFTLCNGRAAKCFWNCYLLFNSLAIWQRSDG
jgi:hypothetical protein